MREKFKGKLHVARSLDGSSANVELEGRENCVERYFFYELCPKCFLNLAKGKWKKWKKCKRIEFVETKVEFTAEYDGRNPRAVRELK